MSLTSKRHKLADEQSEDRFSNLPSSLIGYILSFLPTKDVVATSVLSTTWRDFWTLITRLYIDDYLLLSTQDKNRTELLQAEFVEFMYRVLLVGRFPCLEVFRLCCHHSYNPHYVSAWIACVSKSNVQELDVSVSFKDKVSLVLPRCLFSCTTLVKLKLSRHFYMDVPGSVFFPCLKSVNLSWVEFSDDDSITRFLSGCPVLDNLRLLRCCGENVKVVKISVPSLMSLSLLYLHLKEGFDKIMLNRDVPTIRIVLDTPFLQKISIREHVPHGYVFENMHRLTSAVIDIPSPFYWGMELVRFKDVHHAAASDLLKGISQVRKLHFFTLGIERLDLPTFENLRDMTFGTCQNVKLLELLRLLEASPVLSFLGIELNHGTRKRINDANNDTFELDASRIVPICLQLHLKTIEIVNFRGSNKEVELVEYLLRNARVLEKIKVKVQEKQPKAIELLLSLPRASRACQIEIL